jgi:hypothetical protein
MTTKRKPKAYVERARSAETGRFVPLAFAKAYPNLTIVERVPRRGVSQ